MERVLTAAHPDYRTDTTAKSTGAALTNKPALSESESMKALCWHGVQRVSVDATPKPLLTEAGDAVVRITTTTVCGSDLHLYFEEVQGMSSGFIIGHEACGYIEACGPGVKNFKPGDRVAISAVIACGECEYCAKQQFSLCDRTNVAGASGGAGGRAATGDTMEKLMGHRTAALFGYAMAGQVPGLQAEFARVPLADMNLLKLPPETQFPDEKALMLSDVACTGWHANECAEVRQGDNVVIFGAGPVGQVSAMWAKYRGAARVMVIDHFDYRLHCLKDAVPGVETLNFTGIDPVKEIQRAFSATGGPDVCIDCVGFRFPTTLLHKVEQKLRLETDSPEVVNSCIHAVKKGGRIGLIGDYFAYANHFALGALMEKGITVRGGQLYCQKYWAHLLQIMQSGAPYSDPSFIVNAKVPLSRTPDVYKAMSEGQITKAAIYTRFSSQTSGGWPGQPAQPLEALAGSAAGGNAGGGVTGTVLGAAERVAGTVTETVRSGLQKLGL